MQSMDSLWFDYRNGNTFLEFSVSEREQANELMHSKLAHGHIQHLNYYKREKSKPGYKGFAYASAMEITVVPSAKAYIAWITMR